MTPSAKSNNDRPIAVLVEEDGVNLDARWRRCLSRFQRRGIETVGQLFKAYPRLSGEEKFVAICLFMRVDDRRHIPLFLKELSNRNALVSGIAGAALRQCGGPRELPILLRMARSKRRRMGRINALYALAFFGNAPHYELLADFFLKMLGADEADETAFGLAIDGLLNAMLRIDRRTKRYHQGVVMLLLLLEDQRPLGRILAAFSLGRLRIRRAIPEIKQLTHDRNTYPGLGTVAQNAKDAIKDIEDPQWRAK